MTRRLRVRSNIGRQRTGGNRYPSSAHYAESVKASAKAITDQLMSIFNQFEEASEDIMLEALRPTFEKALTYTPYATGELRASGYLEKVGFRGKPQVQIGFGRGGHPDYAVYVHEMTTIPHTAPTRAKFLQAAVFEDQDMIYQRLGAGYRAFMNGGGGS